MRGIGARGCVSLSEVGKQAWTQKTGFTAEHLCVQGVLRGGQGPPGAGLRWKGLRTTCWEGSGKVPRTGPGVLPWPRFSGVRTTREPPGSTEVASETQAPRGSGARWVGR